MFPPINVIVPEGDDVETFQLLRLQPAVPHVAEQNVQVPVSPVSVLPQILPEKPAQGRLELHNVVR